MENINLDRQRQEQARRLARIERRLMVFELGMGAVYVFSWLFSGWSVDLRDYLLTLTASQWLLVILFAAVFGGIYAAINLPLLVYDGYILPHRFGLSRQSFRDWVVDQIKSAALALPLGIILLEIIYAVLRLAPQTWWVWAGFILIAFSVLLANLAPVLIFPIFYKFRPLGEDYRELVDRLMHLAEKAQTEVRGVYQFDMSSRTTTANAALTGLGRTRRIILGDTLLEDYQDDEIETILAHELAHHVHHDIPVGIGIQSLITFGGLFLASIGLNWGVTFFGFDSPSDVATMPLLVLVLSLYGLVTMPLENAYSRWREERADRFALELTGKGDAYASALTRLADQNLSDADPAPWVEFIFHSHPALGKRITRAKAYGTIPLE